MQKRSDCRSVPGWVLILGAGLVVGTGLGFAGGRLLGGHGGSNDSTPPPPVPAASMAPTVPAGPPLPPGTKLPSFSKNWVNGPPLRFGDPAVKLFVIDLWAHWCP